MTERQVPARAKLNLILRVRGRRDDGYHELLTLFERISLADEIVVQVRDEPGVVLEVDGDAPADRTNLAWRAAEHLLRAADEERGLALTLRKFVPAGAGLGGGSADAAAVLQAANGLLGEPLSEPVLASLAAALGADVPFFLNGRMAWGEGIGERLTPIPEPPILHYVLLHPGFAVSTAEMFRAWDEAGVAPSEEAMPLESVASATPRELAGRLHNDLEAVTAARHPEIEEMRQALLEAGALGARMSGSGPTVFGLFEEDAEARRAYDVLVGSGRFSAIHTRGE